MTNEIRKEHTNNLAECITERKAIDKQIEICEDKAEMNDLFIHKESVDEEIAKLREQIHLYQDVALNNKRTSFSLFFTNHL